MINIYKQIVFNYLKTRYNQEKQSIILFIGNSYKALLPLTREEIHNALVELQKDGFIILPRNDLHNNSNAWVKSVRFTDKALEYFNS